MDKLEQGLQTVLAGLQMAVDGYNESIAGKRTLDDRLTDLEQASTVQTERLAHMQETIDALQRILLDGRGAQ